MKKIIVAISALALFVPAFAEGVFDPGAWNLKFYNGLEAAGSSAVNPSGFRGDKPSIDLKWESGMAKFGVAKSVDTKLKGVVDWSVSAYVRCGKEGRASVAMEFFDVKGKSLGVQNGISRSFENWTKVDWKFTSPKKAERAEVHLLSLSEAPVSFASVSVASSQGIDKNEVPFDMKILPAEWNRDWNGGKMRMLNFTDAPIPMTVLLKGVKSELKAPSFEIDLPECLELKDAFCAFNTTYGSERPVSLTMVEVGGRRVNRLRFERMRYLPRMKDGFDTDKGGGITLVIGPKSDVRAGTYPIACRISDGDRLAAERIVEMEFRPMPKGLRVSKNFIAMGWNNADRRFADDDALLAALKAYEAAGIRFVRLDRCGLDPFPRVGEIRNILDKRPVSYIHAARLGDLWMMSRVGLNKKLLAAMGGRLSVTSDKAGRRANKICPQFFSHNERFYRHLEEFVIPQILTKSGVKDGDWVTMDMEPWQSGTYCYCTNCLTAFGKFAKLDHVPDMAEALTKKDVWAEFRVRHSARAVEMVKEILHRYNPTLKLVDYDYILEYGNPESRANFIRGCAKDTLMNEQWLDGHLCSYYHRIGKRSFEAMKNNVRHLKKAYYPMAGLSGFASWIRPGEVLNPQQVRQFALAAFVNGCPGYAFYSGNCFDGEMLIAMMEAQDIVARYEDLPWGKADGKTAVEGPAEQMAYASVVRKDGSEVVAVFNYDGDEPIEVRIAGKPCAVEPLGVKFIEVEK